MSVIPSFKRIKKGIDPCAYLDELCVFKVKTVLRNGILAQADSNAFRSDSERVLKHTFFCNSFPGFEQFNVDDYVLGCIRSLDFKKRNFTFEVKLDPYGSRVQGCVLKKCENCLVGYYRKQNKALMCDLCGDQTSPFSNTYSVHYQEISFL